MHLEIKLREKVLKMTNILQIILLLATLSCADPYEELYGIKTELDRVFAIKVVRGEIR